MVSAPADPGQRSISIGRKVLLALAASLALFLLLEGSASLLLAWHDSGEEPALTEETHCDYDPDLGWVNRKSARVADLYGPGRTLTTNAQGFRGLEDYSSAVPAGRYRIVCLGDSFTLGYGIDDADTYPAQLEALEPRIQAVNMGQGGYGIDQCYLWYLRDGTPLEVNLLVLAFIAPDFERMGEARFQGEYPKPLLRIEGGVLKGPEAPLPRDWESARTARRWHRFLTRFSLADLCTRALRHRAGASALHDSPLPRADSPQNQSYQEVAALVLADLTRLSRERGQALALVHLPLRDPRAGDPERLLAWLRPCAAALGVPLIDLAGRFERLPPGQRDACYLADGHLNPWGNRLVAQELLEELRGVVPSFPR